MARILVTMSDDSYRKVIGDELECRLRQLGDLDLVLDAGRLSNDDYARHWQDAEYALTGWGVRPPDAAWFDQRTKLRAICHAAGSVRMFPRRLLQEGIVITSARAAIARTVAEFCLAAVLTLLRHMACYDARTAKTISSLAGSAKPRTETLFGKTVLLVGLGHVGRHFLDLLQPFKVRVLVADPYLREDDAARLGVTLVTLDEGIPQADVISLHAPDIPETHGLVGPKQIAKIREGAIFVNTARGRLVDTAALTEALAACRFSAALDVTDPEPLPETHPLRRMPNVLLTPHVAGPTTDELPSLGSMAVADLERLLKGQKPEHAIDLEAYDRMSF